MGRTLYAIGNWKMYKTSQEALHYLEELAPLLQNGQKGVKAEVCLAVPYTSIRSAAEYGKEIGVKIGAQNMNDAREGAFTGEIAGLMLKEAGAEFVLLGHSERRHLFGEGLPFIHKKVVRALQEGLQPILCVGETLEEREAGREEEVLREQIESALEGISAAEGASLLLAYEPVWAIGTGKPSTPKMAGEAHAFCRKVLEEVWGKKAASQVSILYGGSVKPETVALLLAEKEIDGVLVGGASLDPKTFAEIASHCVKKTAPKPRKNS